jgi:hypothetical protein
MIGKTVELRLTIFRARTTSILTQIYYCLLADFSSTRSRVGGLHTTPPQPRTGGEARRISCHATGEAGLGEGSEPETAGPSQDAV